LACTPLSRGLGIGSKLVQEVLVEAGNRRLILEVEPPVDELTKRRIGFYERLGFTLNPYDHYQAPLNPTTGVVELKIMSSLGALSQDEQKAYRRILNTKVYEVEDDFMI
ncbi:MAG: GNAT family N-acetyltransferase, partial [Turicibacter sp.]|nr:GNAT family N-acetyltransferase [Turicibacter sp.]